MSSRVEVISRYRSWVIIKTKTTYFLARRKKIKHNMRRQIETKNPVKYFPLFELTEIEARTYTFTKEFKKYSQYLYKTMNP